MEPERLRQQFPTLDEVDLAAYVRVTHEVLGRGADRGRKMAALLATARGAREKQAKGVALSAEEALGLRYLVAVEKMQAPTTRR